MIVQSNGYADFQETFGNLGGGKKTLVLASDQTGPGGSGAFTIVATFPDQDFLLRVTVDTTKPSSFDADFPHAVYVYGFDFSG